MNRNRTALLVLTAAEEEALEVALKHRYSGNDELQHMTESQLNQTLKMIHGDNVHHAIPAFGRWIGTEFYVFGRTENALVTRLDELQAGFLYDAVLGLLENPELCSNIGNTKIVGGLLDKLGSVDYELTTSKISLF